MSVFYENQFIVAQMEDNNSLVRFTYKKHENYLSMPDEIYKEAMLAYADAVEKHLPPKLIVDSRHSQFTLGIELQEWTAQKIGSRTTCLKKMAFVMSEDIFAQVSIEQMMEEDEIAEYDNKPRYFKTLAGAEEWVKL